MQAKMIKQFSTAHPDGVSIKTFFEGQAIDGEIAEYLVSRGVAILDKPEKKEEQEPEKEEIKTAVVRRGRPKK